MKSINLYNRIIDNSDLTTQFKLQLSYTGFVWNRLIFNSRFVWDKDKIKEQGNSIFANPIEIKDIRIIKKYERIFVKEKINTILFYTSLEDKTELFYYTHLNNFQRIRFKIIFKKYLILKKEFLMWFINIIVAVGAVTAAFVNAFKLIK